MHKERLRSCKYYVQMAHMIQATAPAATTRPNDPESRESVVKNAAEDLKSRHRGHSRDLKFAMRALAEPYLAFAFPSSAAAVDGCLSSQLT